MQYLPDTDSEDELPPGWEQKTVEDGRVCYVNQHDKRSQFTHPRTGRVKRVAGKLPINWEQTIDKETNQTMFINKDTKQSTYVDPRVAFAVEEPTFQAAKVRQRFDASTTAFQILHGKDLHGKLAVITGANCGIGFETARSLAFHGCEVVFACRNRKTTEDAIAKIVSERPTTQSRCRFVELDLACFKSVQNFIKEIKDSVRHIDYLILNAGVFALPHSLTENGLETTFQVSHLSHFYLTLQLETLFNHTSRVVVLSSESHRYANLPADNLTVQHLSPTPDKYWAMMAYNNAKLCNVLFAKELANRWKDRGVSVFCVHPGNMVSTHIQRNWWFYRLLFAFVRPFTKSLQQAAATTIYCVVADELTGLTGYYFNNCFFCEPSKLAKNEQLRQRLWELSENLVQELSNNGAHNLNK